MVQPRGVLCNEVVKIFIIRQQCLRLRNGLITRRRRETVSLTRQLQSLLAVVARSRSLAATPPLPAVVAAARVARISVAWVGSSTASDAEAAGRSQLLLQQLLLLLGG